MLLESRKFHLSGKNDIFLKNERQQLPGIAKTVDIREASFSVANNWFSGYFFLL